MVVTPLGSEAGDSDIPATPATPGDPSPQEDQEVDGEEEDEFDYTNELMSGNLQGGYD